MINRRLFAPLLQRLQEVPAVALLGPRQVGKTSLAWTVNETLHGTYLDLESPEDLAKLTDPQLFLRSKVGQLVILDEIQRMPELFPVLRSLIDEGRRQGFKTSQYLLLGSASPHLLRQSSETLAGRISFLELAPFDVLEVDDMSTLWLRGGFPDSFLALSDAASLRWRQDFIRTYLEREIPQFAPRISPLILRRLWTMLAHQQGGLLNSAQLARNLGTSAKTINHYLELLEALFLIRRLPPYHVNIKKRLIKSPKLYLRDSGLVHALLGIGNQEALLSHPIIGGSWEGFVIEQLLIMAQPTAEGYFYRTSGGAEIDLILEWPDGSIWAIEVKYSLQPKPSKGFYSAIEDIKPDRAFIAYPGVEQWPIAKGVEAIPVKKLAQLVWRTHEQTRP